MRGFYGVVAYQPKRETNVGTLFRTCYLYDCKFIGTIGPKYQKQSSDTTKTWKHQPLFQWTSFDEFFSCIPKETKLVGVELAANSRKLDLNYIHPERCVYIMGNEANGLPKQVMDKCDHLVQIPYVQPISLNVAVAGSIIIHDRYIKGLK